MEKDLSRTSQVCCLSPAQSSEKVLRMKIGLLLLALLCIGGWLLYKAYQKGYRVDWSFFRR